MAGALVMGVDIGSYSAKGVLCTAGGEVLADYAIEHEMSLPRPGWVEQDADRVWWAGFVTICQALLARSGRSGAEVGAVGVSAIGPCMLPVDAAGRPLRPGVLYGIDTRAAEEITWLEGQFGAEELFALGGTPLTSQAVGPKILWLRRHEPEIYARTATFLSASGYIVLRLTGERVTDAYTASGYTPLFDLAAGTWSDRFAGPIVDPDRLPRILYANEVAGTVTAEAAKATGLAPGTPITAGTVDAVAEAVGAGAVRPGDLMVMYGTTTFFILASAQPASDPRLWAVCHALPGLYGLAAGMSTTGGLTRWLRDQFAPDLRAGQEAGGPNAYAVLSDQAAGVPPGAQGLMVLPYFAGERTPINDPLARGVIAGLTLSHSRAHLYRALLEATGYGIRHNLEVMQAAIRSGGQQGPAGGRLVAVGGGAQSATWLGIVSDICGLVQQVPARAIGAPYGDAFLAALATGLVDGLAALDRDWARIDRTVTPDGERHALYGEYYAIYRSLYERTVNEQHALALLGQRGAVKR